MAVFVFTAFMNVDRRQFWILVSCSFVPLELALLSVVRDKLSSYGFVISAARVCRRREIWAYSREHYL